LIQIVFGRILESEVVRMYRIFWSVRSCSRETLAVLALIKSFPALCDTFCKLAGQNGPNVKMGMDTKEAELKNSMNGKRGRKQSRMYRQALSFESHRRERLRSQQSTIGRS
jgi:hypothetical protein